MKKKKKKNTLHLSFFFLNQYFFLFEITVREQNQLPAIAAWCGWESGEDRFFGVVWVVIAELIVVMMIADVGMVGG